MLRQAYQPEVFPSVRYRVTSCERLKSTLAKKGGHIIASPYRSVGLNEVYKTKRMSLRNT